MARAFGYVLATRDAKILEYGSQGHVRVREAKRGRKAPQTRAETRDEVAIG